jgi:hypothetical protein
MQGIARALHARRNKERAYIQGDSFGVGAGERLLGFSHRAASRWWFDDVHPEIKRFVLVIGIFTAQLFDMSSMQDKQDDDGNHNWNSA